MAIFRGTGSAASTTDQTTIDTTTQNVVDAEAAQAAAEAARDAAEGFKDDAEDLYGDLAAVNTAKTAAETAASNASTSESNAATSASDAADDAASANESFILTRGAFLDFQTLYLGVLASDPTEDNEGNPLEEGALYFNSTDDVMRTYDGSQWFTAFASLGGALVGTNNLSDVADAATSLTNLGLNATAAEINVLDVSAETPTDGQVLTYDTSNGLNWETPSTEQNDLTASVTWANVPDANITESSVTQHEAALSVAHTQVTGLGTAATLDVGTSANNIVQLNGSGALPAVDGSNLTNVSSVANLDDLTDVDTTGVADGETIVYNSGTSSWEPGVAGGNTTANGLWENSNSITSNYTITTNYNAMSAGPVTVDTGVTVTIPTGSRWVVV